MNKLSYEKQKEYADNKEKLFSYFRLLSFML